jgi:DNA-binding MarR family transcriptional regulator
VIKTDPGERILEELSRLIRQLTRISGGPDEARAMTATQRLALFELVDSGPLRLNDLAQRMGTSAPTASRRSAARWAAEPIARPRSRAIART